MLRRRRRSGRLIERARGSAPFVEVSNHAHPHRRQFEDRNSPKLRGGVPFAIACVLSKEGTKGLSEVLSCDDAHSGNFSALGSGVASTATISSGAFPSERWIRMMSIGARDRSRTSLPLKTWTTQKSRR